MAKGSFTISGAGVDRNGFQSAAIALSAAITVASRAAGDATVYVRDDSGDVQGRVERQADGYVYIYGQRHYERQP